MNDPRTPIISSANRVESKTAPVHTESMKAHPSVSRTLERLAADMNTYMERMPLDTNLVTRITSLVA
jgi:hypothetical protein